MGKKTGTWKSFIRVVQGVIIGGGAILPGVSGGVLCVLFGIYRPMMEFLAHPIRSLRKNFKLFIPVGIGWLWGFLIFAKLLAFIFEKFELYAVCLFIGLIGGTVPGLYKQAGKEGRTGWSVAAMLGAFALLFAVLALVRYGDLSAAIEPNFGWYVFCGVLWGVSIVVPGMSSSSILISLGLYQPMAAGIGDLNPLVILPWALGLFATAFATGKVINHLFNTHYGMMSHAVVGIVAASTLAIVPLSYGSAAKGLLCALCCAVGVFCAWLMDRFEITGDM